MPSIAPISSQSKYPQFKFPDISPPFFWLGMVVIFLVSLALRFWGLSRFNTLVFDEVYYAKFASEFLKRELVFTGHPPLSTYIIAIGIRLGQLLPWGQQEPFNGLSGLVLSPFSYRWLNALVGSCIPLLVAGIALQLSLRRSFALVAGVLMAADGLYLVESRYALNNVYLVTFGLLGNLFFLVALRSQAWQRWLWLALAGVGFGASAAIKWNGLGFLLGAYAVWVAGWVLYGLQVLRNRQVASERSRLSPFPLHNLPQLHLGHILLCFVVIPAITYYLSWIPYMQLDSGSTFWGLQLQTLNYHERVGGLDAHPYCSLWYTWPLMLRPIAYFYQTTHGAAEPVPVVGPPTPGNAGTVIYDVHAMGNPFLWWLSSVAIVLIGVVLIQQVWQWLSSLATASAGTTSDGTPSHHLTSAPNSTAWITLYLILNWGANFLPWVKVTRCVFLYHYMESLIFAVIALAWLTDRWLFSTYRTNRTIGLAILCVVLMAFLFWMPLYLGLPISPFELQIRRWLQSWV